VTMKCGLLSWVVDYASVALPGLARLSIVPKSLQPRYSCRYSRSHNNCIMDKTKFN